MRRRNHKPEPRCKDAQRFTLPQASTKVAEFYAPSQVRSWWEAKHRCHSLKSLEVSRTGSGEWCGSDFGFRVFKCKMVSTITQSSSKRERPEHSCTVVHIIICSHPWFLMMSMVTMVRSQYLSHLWCLFDEDNEQITKETASESSELGAAWLAWPMVAVSWKIPGDPKSLVGTEHIFGTTLNGFVCVCLYFGWGDWITWAFRRKVAELAGPSALWCLVSTKPGAWTKLVSTIEV